MNIFSGSPSPLPSPVGRGRIALRLAGNNIAELFQNGSGQPRRIERSSLSQRERENAPAVPCGHRFFEVALLSALLLTSSVIGARADTTINPTNRYAFGANVGWQDWLGDTNHGVVIGPQVCSGYIFSPNLGWINMGDGNPTNGVQYQNLSANDFGVNVDGSGNLRGFAYGANIGWVNFETNGAARVDLASGILSGFAFSPTCGWISLSNEVAFVQTQIG